uniref:C-type lectin domain-containing protein n=1 Tax=Oryzias latipes TaxID=8090 RepID=A0A3B3ICQ3_ORYLA
MKCHTLSSFNLVHYLLSLISCPPSGFQRLETNSSHVVYVEESLNWADAQSFCRNRHTDLISGPEQMEKLDEGKMEKLFPGSKNDFIFISLFRGAWQWSDGSSFSFRFWNLQYDDERKDSSCAMMNEGGRWSSEKCSEEHPFICYDGKRRLKVTDQWRWMFSCCLCMLNMLKCFFTL